MEKILLVSLIGAIFLIAWLYSKKTKKEKVQEEVFDKVLPAPSDLKLSRHDKVSGKLFKRKYTPLHPKEKQARQEKFWMMQYNLRLQGLYWYDNKLYWLTRKLMEEHKND